MIVDTKEARTNTDSSDFFLASIVLGRTLMDLEAGGDRKSRKRRVLDRRLAALRKALPDASFTAELSSVMAPRGFAREQGVEIVVDLAFSDPFAPYVLAVSQSDFGKALRSTASEMQFGTAFVDRVLAVQAEAMGAHSRRFFSSPWPMIVAGALASAALLPLLPGFIGATAGLYGAVGAAHGLAVLGGGSLATGGLGMAGGTWVLAGLGAAATATAGFGGLEFVHSAPVDVIRTEVAKCQTTVALNMENGTWSRDDVAEQLKGLDRLKNAVEKDITEERELNDSDSARIRELDEKLKALVVARTWIAKKMG